MTFENVVRPLEPVATYRCPCCRSLTLHGRGQDEISPVCLWEDDGQDDHDADLVRGGPNGSLSLTEGRQNYLTCGAADPAWRKHVRPPGAATQPISDQGHGEDEGPTFTVRLLVKHPSWDLADLTRDLGLTPHMTHTVGEARQTPKGNPLPGVYRESAWSYWIEVTGERRVFKSAAALIDRLEGQGDLLRRLSEGGGTTCLIFDLQGYCNVGDVLGWRDLARLAALRVDLGVEVFP